MWSTYEVVRKSDLLIVVVNADADGDFELLSVKGQSKSLSKDAMSDVEWFNHYYDGAGPEEALFGDEEEIDAGKHWFKGRMIADKTWTDYGWEYDDHFEVEEYKPMDEYFTALIYRSNVTSARLILRVDRMGGERWFFRFDTTSVEHGPYKRKMKAIGEASRLLGIPVLRAEWYPEPGSK